MLSFTELPPGAQRRVFWSFLWRALLIGVGSMIGGFIAGFIAGFLVAITNDFLSLHLAREVVSRLAQIFGGIAGVLVGVCMLWVYIKWLFRSSLGGYSLRLVSAQQSGI